MINQTCRALMEFLDRDSSGRPKNHRLLLSLDEFPTLGRLDFFTMNLRQMAGYGIKAHLIVQSFNDIIEQYGINNTILDNCHILSTFAAADTVTCQRISQMVGTVTEYRESYSEPGRNIGVRNISHSEHVRPLLSPGDIRELSVDDQLMFVTGYKPMRVKKVRYYSDPTFTKRLLPAPDQSAYLNVPAKPKIDWLHERPKGQQLMLPGSGNNGLLSDGRSPAVPDDEVDREVPDERPRSEGEYT
jgi:type IV secretion system protein VirD4